MKLILKTYQFFKKRSFLLYALITCVLSGFIFFASQLTLQYDVSKTFSEQKGLDDFKKVLEQKKFNTKILFSIEWNDSLSSDEKNVILNEICTHLSLETTGLIDGYRYKDSSDIGEVMRYLYSNLPYFFDKDLEKLLSDKSSSDSIQKALEEDFQILSGSGSIFLEDLIIQDPLRLSLSLMDKNFSNFPSDRVNQANGNFLDAEGNNLIISEYHFHLLDNDAASEAREILENSKEELEKTYPINLSYFSSFVVTLENSDQVQKDANFSLIFGLTIVLLILIIFYRSLLIPIVFVIPCVFGALFSLTVIYFVKGEISIISVGTGSAVIGIVLDFSFHFFTHLKKSNSIAETIKEISLPLIMGGITTILAFVSLLFINSPILKDFGLFTSLTLLGAILFILFLYPALLSKLPLPKYKNTSKTGFILPPFVKKSLTLIILIVFGFSLFHLDKIQFDNQLINLNYQSKQTKKLESKLNFIDSKNSQRIFVFVSPENTSDTKKTYENLHEKLISIQEDNKITSFINSSPFYPSESKRNSNIRRWKAFMDKNGDSIKNHIYNSSEKLGIHGDAFSSFYNAMNGDFPLFDSEYKLDQFKDLEDNGTFITVADIPREHLAYAKAEINKIEGVYVLDPSSTSTKMANSVRDDFNFILFVSALIVFITLVILYGRIELALLTFLPMVISWVIICGITVWFDIQFNFVNIIVATFIFGIGDDFSIFVTDGYVRKNATGKQNIGSFNTGIFLSALTTIIGTGVMLFSKHPAMHSIASISVIGLIVIFFVSQTIQPYLLEFLINRRTDKGKPAWTLPTLFYSIFSFSYFLFGCVLLYIILGLLMITPAPKIKKQSFYRKIMQLFCASLVYIMAEIKNEHLNKEFKDFSEPKVLIANHSSFLDILLLVMQSHKLVILTNDWVYNSPFFGPHIRYAGFLQASKGIDENIKAIKELVEQGNSVAIFPEGKRSKKGKIGRFHKGAFYLADKLQLPIQAVILHGTQYTMSKSDFMLKTGTMTVAYQKPIQTDDKDWGETYQERTKSISRWFKSEYDQLRNQIETPSYYQLQISNSYLYTSPVVEWYVKIKYRIEKKYYNKILNFINPNEKIYDMGCGLGYLTYLIHLKFDKTPILGIDYDQDKIEVASNNYIGRNQELVNFEYADIKKTNLESSSTILLGDVLHYLSVKEQNDLIAKCSSSLISGGRLIIREGFSDQEGHSNTEKTEQYATQIFNFNKKESEFQFPKFNELLLVTKNYNLQLVEDMNDDKNSNRLLIFEKR